MNTNQREQKNAAFSQQVNDWFHFPGRSEANVSLYPYFPFIPQSCLANS